MRRGYICALLAGLTLPVLVGAQSARDSSLYLQAEQMVANGDASGGRRLADSVAAAAQIGSAGYVEGLYWRATLAMNARDSEHEYQQIIVDYPLSGRVPDALLRIGQLESARGDNTAALRHFQRLVLEHPESPLRAEASYWVARTYFETNDVTHACTANADAVVSVPLSNIELKNRIDFQQQRCRGVALATDTTPARATVPADTAPSPTRAKESKASKTAARGSYTVQVAAFRTKAPATALAARLRGRGYGARIDDARAPYRVRIGHYSTHAAAAAELVKLKAKQINGFVTER